jgi:hypothetical protein
LEAGNWLPTCGWIDEMYFDRTVWWEHSEDVERGGSRACVIEKNVLLSIAVIEIIFAR